MYGEHRQNADSGRRDPVPLKIILVLVMIVMIMAMFSSIFLGGAKIINPYVAGFGAVVAGLLGWVSSVFIDRL